MYITITTTTEAMAGRTDGHAGGSCSPVKPHPTACST